MAQNIARLEDAYRREMLRRYVKAFLDLLVLAILNSRPRCGYEILATIHRGFGVLISPGTLYPLLHMLEERGLIEGRPQNRRKNYVLTRKGLETFTVSSRIFETLSSNFVNIMSTSLLEKNMI